MSNKRLLADLQDEWEHMNLDEYIQAMKRYKNNKYKKQEDVGCDHKWKQYVGFTETYWYCETCQFKTNEGVS